MHDIRTIRDNPNAFTEGLARRGLDNAHKRIEDLLRLDQLRREAETGAQKDKARLNILAREIGASMKAGDTEEAEGLKAQVADIKHAMSAKDTMAQSARAKTAEVLATLPNLAADDVPDGMDETGNAVLEIIGGPTNGGDHHADFGPGLGMDFEAGTKLAGARFTVLKGKLAQLQRALGQFMLDTQVFDHGYTEISVPLLVKQEIMHGTGQLPKFANDCFNTSDGRWLIPTAEVALTNLVREEILYDLENPERYTALTPCFRAEAGAAGRDTRGYIRQHQFEKVEMVTICREEDALAQHEAMLRHARRILDLLKLPYRVVLLCAGDMGFAARKTYDLEVWMPGQNTYREIASISWCGDFQGRRMNARYRDENGKTRFVHTLNGSGLAVGRTLAAVMENYLQYDGTLMIPEVLQARMGGAYTIGFVDV